MNPNIIERIKALPPLPRTLLEIQAVCNRSDGTVAELSHIVEQDPMIVANLLKSANSPLYGFGKTITSVGQAVALFGMSMTHSIALHTAIRKLLNVDMAPYGISSDEFAHISSMQASLMASWYAKVDPEKKDLLVLASLIQESGKIVIADMIIQEDLVSQFKFDIQATHNIAQVEFEYVKETSASITAAIFKFWGFESKLVEAIGYSDHVAKAPDAIRPYAVALNIVKTAVPINGPLTETSILAALKKAQMAGLDYELLEEEIDKLLERAR